MSKFKLHWKILISISLACVAGMLSGTDAELFGFRYYYAYEFVGTLFLNALKMIIVPLITSSIICGMTGIADSHALGRLGFKTIFYYIATSLIAILTGLLMVNLIMPGIIDGVPVGQTLGFVVDKEYLQQNVANHGIHDVVNIFQRMIPANIVEAAAAGNMLGLIFFSVLFGSFMTHIDSEYSAALKKIWQGIFDTMMLITIWVMKHVAPVGVFGLVAKTIAETGFGGFRPILSFFIATMLALMMHVGVIMPLMLKIFAGVSPVRHFKAMMPALLTAFSTSSSAATLPLTMECVEENANVSNQISSFVLPLGSTINMDGTALYECVAAMFIAQAYGVELSFGMQFTVVLMALLTSIGVAGVPAASLIAIVIILGAIGLPAEAIGLVMVTDRFLDMFRTAANIFGDSCGAVIIASSEGETNLLPERKFEER